MDFNYYDIAIVVIILITALIGFMRGLVWMGIFLTTWTAAIILAIKFKDQLATALPFKLGSEVAQAGLAALLIFLGVLIAGAIINFLFSKAISAIGLGTFDRILGTGLGIALGTLVITLLTMLLGLTELPDQDGWKKSQLIPKFQEAADWIQTLVPEDMSQYINESINGKTDILPTLPPETSSPPSDSNTTISPTEN